MEPDSGSDETPPISQEHWKETILTGNEKLDKMLDCAISDKTSNDIKHFLKSSLNNHILEFKKRWRCLTLHTEEADDRLHVLYKALYDR